MDDGTEARWLTYVELGVCLGVTATAAREHARRRGWPRRAPNKIGAVGHVLVPQDVAMRACAPHAAEPCDTPTNGRQPAHDPPHMQALTAALTVAHEQLRIANERAWRAERLFEEERRHRVDQQQLADQLWTALADAQGAERIANSEAAGLRGELDRRRAWSLPRRLAWAWRGR